MSEQVKEEGTFKIKSKPKQLVKNDILKLIYQKNKKNLKKKKQMPFKSEKQRRWLWKNKPEIALKWTNKYQSPARFLKLKKK